VCAARRPIRILIVDDEEPILHFVQRVLRDDGYETVAASNPETALTLATGEGPFALLLTDLVMPNVPGDELARRLRRDQPDLKVLYLTGYSDRLFESRLLLWESESFLDKPASAKALREAVSLALFGHTHGPQSGESHA